RPRSGTTVPPGRRFCSVAGSCCSRPPLRRCEDIDACLGALIELAGHEPIEDLLVGEDEVRGVSSCLEPLTLLQRLFVGLRLSLVRGDADYTGWHGDLWCCTETFRVFRVIRLQGPVPLPPYVFPGPVMDLIGGEQRDPGMPMFGVVPHHIVIDMGSGGLE